MSVLAVMHPWYLEQINKEDHQNLMIEEANHLRMLEKSYRTFVLNYLDEYLVMQLFSLFDDSHSLNQTDPSVPLIMSQLSSNL